MDIRGLKLLKGKLQAAMDQCDELIDGDAPEEDMDDSEEGDDEEMDGEGLPPAPKNKGRGINLMIALLGKKKKGSAK